MSEAMYKKQKANNSFFTGDSNVLDLTSRSMVARTLQSVVQTEQQVVEVSVESTLDVPTSSDNQVTSERE